MLPMFIVSGFLLDRYNVKKTIISVSVVYTLCSFVQAIANSFEVFCWCRAISGACGGFCLLSLIVLASQEFGESNISKITGVMITVGMLGGLVAQAPLQLLLVRYGFETTLFINAFLGMMCALLITFTLGWTDNKTNKKTTISIHEIKKVFKNKKLFIVGFYAGLMFLPITILGGFCGTEYLVAYHNMQRTTATIISGMIFIGFIVGSSFFGMVVNSIISEKNCMIGGAVMICFFSFIAIFNEHLNVLFAVTLYFLIGFCSATQVISFPLIARSVDKTILGASEGTMSIIIMLQTALFQTMFGYIIDYYKSYTVALGAFFALLMAGVVTSLYIKDPKQ
jgi:MFS family permease